jgi:hypothetical protein
MVASQLDVLARRGLRECVERWPRRHRDDRSGGKEITPIQQYFPRRTSNYESLR